MNAGAATQRTSPIRVESLVAISTYKGDLDYGTNFMGVKMVEIPIFMKPKYIQVCTGGNHLD